MKVSIACAILAAIAHAVPIANIDPSTDADADCNISLISEGPKITFYHRCNYIDCVQEEWEKNQITVVTYTEISVIDSTELEEDSESVESVPISEDSYDYTDITNVSSDNELDADVW
jgi:NADH dehydrogenase FAD-containing subunit